MSTPGSFRCAIYTRKSTEEGLEQDFNSLDAQRESCVAGKVDAVVVYKIDRLTRSLMDFARIVEVFDAHKVSFVSVTSSIP
jgi:site-specific DNA recombinase